MAVRVRDDPAWLRETVVPRILAACPEAERIWLFGSRARGDHHDGSGWDVMVVVPDDSDPSLRAQLRQAVSAAVRGQRGLQALVMAHGEFHDRLHLRASFPSTIAREGIILHEETSMSGIDAAMWLRRAAENVQAMDDLLAVAEPRGERCDLPGPVA